MPDLNYDMNIKVNIALVFTDESEKTIQRLNELGKAMADFSKFALSGAASVDAVNKSVGDTGKVVVDSAAMLKQFNDSMGITAANQKEFAELNKRTAIGLRMQTLALQTMSIGQKKADKTLQDFEDSLSQFKVDPTADRLQKVTSQFKDLDGNTISAAAAIDRIGKVFGRAGPLLSIDAFAGLKESFGGDMGQVVTYISQLDEALGGINGRIQFLQNLMLTNPALVEEWAASMSKANLEMYKLNMASQMAIGQIGAMNLAWMDLGRTFFWTGLGTMFALMTIQRISRSGVQMEANELSLTRSLQAEQEAQEKLNRYRNAGITSGKAYTAAAMEAREATMARKLSEDRLRDSILSHNLSMLQLAFGTVPTVIRTTVDLYRESMKLFMANVLNTQATKQLTQTTLAGGVANKVATVSVWGFTMSTTAATIAVAALTAAMTLGVSVLMMYLGSLEATSSIENANREFSKLKNTMTVSHSPALYEVFGIIGQEMDRTSVSMSKYSQNARRVSTSLSTLKSMNDQFTASLKTAQEEIQASHFNNVERLMADVVYPSQLGPFNKTPMYTGPTPLYGAGGMLPKMASTPSSMGIGNMAGFNTSPLTSMISSNGNMLQRGTSIGSIPGNAKSITININGPVTVKDESDIDKLSNRIVSAISRR